MRIPEQDLNSLLEKTLLGVKGAKESKPPSDSEAQNASASADRVNISEKARTFQQLSQLASAELEDRSARVDEIKKAVENGSYHVDTKATAEGLLRSTLLDSQS